ncbi:DNA/RNA non-specific endonuclease [Aerococcus sp. 1KP-2016]|uniref:DNA/RNA non-specific endonuclease n=1 Tax=Aerococcus sp. 1KP-2016 TaxID=1981982 RepID=UPI000BC6581C|nr:DNA/RNA non-specific endonuclease [Aerococcus sp. 1KP-2016]OYQ65509.1 hypothetical protein B9P78_08355 [Aerococcus sp. 1KP-2016]
MATLITLLGIILILWIVIILIRKIFVAMKRRIGTNTSKVLAIFITLALIFSIFHGLFKQENSEQVVAEQETWTNEIASEVSTSSTDTNSISSEAQVKSSYKTTKQSSEQTAFDAEKTKTASLESDKTAESKAQAAATSSVEKANEITQSANRELSVVRQVPDDQEYLEINDNVPFFTNADITSTVAYEAYGDLDSLGRVTQANAVLGIELMPDDERDAIEDIRPTGWQQAKYANVSGGWLYNRSHLIGYQLAGENANPRNLMTGTRWFNVEGMLPFENYVANYIEENDYHIRYRITPVFDGENLLASGIYMEGFSIEDNGALQFNIYIPNRQPGVTIDYFNGASTGPQGPAQDESLASLQSSSQETNAIAESPANSNGDISAIDSNHNGQVSIKEAKAAGYSMPIDSRHWLYPFMTDGDGDGLVGE